MRTARAFSYLIAFCALANARAATTLDTIGVTLLRQVDSSLMGNGVNLVHPEGSSTASPLDFEVNPEAVGQPVSLFTYISSNGTANVFPNSEGSESSHADSVGLNLYGPSSGVAPQVVHVDNYDALYFVNNVIFALLPPAISGLVVNQSFVFDGLAQSDQMTANQDYDDYAAGHGTLFVSGIGNGGAVLPPATCFNGIGVGAYGGASSTGPNFDGRSKPDITAPAIATSFSTPYVTGSAVLLLQGATRGDGGANTTAAADLRTLKALLLNGAVKPAGWTNGSTTPLDARYGAGLVNVFNSWQLLRDGQHAFIEATSNTMGAPHPPGTNPNNEPTLAGWDFNSISNPRSVLTYKEEVNHYYFNLSAASSTRYTLQSTLVWNRQSKQTSINDLNLFLYNMANGSLVAASTSAVDNVEHIFASGLAPGRYDLQVQKNPTGQVSQNESYAVAFEFFTLQLNVLKTNGNVAISYPLVPAGFTLQSTTSFVLPTSWSPVSTPASIANNQNLVLLPDTGSALFFRLQGP
jgi:hypothetical protein